tara:strand:- start:191 stop:349 length:159 start_codon:yes stop_codon:yes gene_type:complete
MYIKNFIIYIYYKINERQIIITIFLAVISAEIILLAIKLNQKDNFVCKSYKK